MGIRHEIVKEIHWYCDKCNKLIDKEPQHWIGCYVCGKILCENHKISKTIDKLYIGGTGGRMEVVKVYKECKDIFPQFIQRVHKEYENFIFRVSKIRAEYKGVDKCA